jgi:hypothetical protein
MKTEMSTKALRYISNSKKAYQSYNNVIVICSNRFRQGAFKQSKDKLLAKAKASHLKFILYIIDDLIISIKGDLKRLLDKELNGI